LIIKELERYSKIKYKASQEKKKKIQYKIIKGTKKEEIKV